MKFPVRALTLAVALAASGAASAQEFPSGDFAGFHSDPMRNLMAPRVVPQAQRKKQSAAAEACADANGKISLQDRVDACGKLIDSGVWKGADIAWAYSNRCFALFRLGKRDKALSDCDKAVELDPKNAVAFQARAMIEQDGGDSEKALADFDKAAQLGANNAALFSDRGNLLLAKGEADKALADYDQAIALNGGSPTAYIERGGAWLAKGEADKATADYAKALSIAPNNAFAVFNLGVASYLKGDKVKAAEALRQALKLDPTNAYAGLWLFLAHDDADGKADLKAYSGKFNAGAWPWPVVQYDLGAIDAERLLAAPQTPGDQCEAQFYLGASALKKGAGDEAAAHLRKATEICPKNFFEYFGAVAGLKAVAPALAKPSPATEASKTEPTAGAPTAAPVADERKPAPAADESKATPAAAAPASASEPSPAAELKK